MSNAGTEGRATKNQRREAAREKARQLREEQRRRAKRNKFFMGGGIVIGALAVLAVIALMVINSIRPPGPYPANMASDGLVIGAGVVAESTPALPGDADPVKTVPSDDPAVVDIQVYFDYLCPYCGLFEQNYGDTLESWLKEGSIRLELHPVATQNRRSLGTQYPTRAANAFACVANYSPDDAWAFNRAMFVDQPAEGTKGLTDEQIIERLAKVGPEFQDEIETCITKGTYEPWVTRATARALSDESLQNPANNSFGTPTVFVNGERWDGATELPQFVQQVQGKAIVDDSDKGEDDTTG